MSKERTNKRASKESSKTSSNDDRDEYSQEGEEYIIQ